MSARHEQEAESRSWAVWRQDDNGNKARVRGNLTEAEAQSLAKEFEDRGHRQIYWIRDEAAESL